MRKFEDEIQFIKKHAGVIKPVTNDREAVDIIESHEGISDLEAHKIDQRRVESVLEEFETKVFVLEKKDALPAAKRVIIDMAEPLSYQAMRPLIEALKKDPRCAAVCLLTDNVAGKKFAEERDLDFRRIDEHEKPVVADIPGPFDVAITAVEPPNSPNSVLLFGGKSVFGAKKLYFIASGWVGIGGRNRIKDLVKEGKLERMDEIDVIFCNDELAKVFIENDLPDFPQERIYATGTPSLDSLELPLARKYEKEGRKKLGLDENTLAVIYMGGVQSLFAKNYGASPAIEEETVRKTLEAISAIAEFRPEDKFALLLRSHPRDPDKDRIYALSQDNMPPNVQVKMADNLSVNEAAYASDVIVSLSATENFMAHYRGRKAAFLAFSGKGMGREFLETVYNPELVKRIEESGYTRVLGSPEELERFLAPLRHEPLPERIEDKAAQSAAKILDMALAS